MNLVKVRTPLSLALGSRNRSELRSGSHWESVTENHSRVPKSRLVLSDVGVPACEGWVNLRTWRSTGREGKRDLHPIIPVGAIIAQSHRQVRHFSVYSPALPCPHNSPFCLIAHNNMACHQTLPRAGSTLRRLTVGSHSATRTHSLLPAAQQHPT